MYGCGVVVVVGRIGVLVFGGFFVLWCSGFMLFFVCFGSGGSSCRVLRVGRG